MFKSWISDEEPKVPKGWGLDVIRTEWAPLCESCGQPIKFKEQYLYSYTNHGVLVLHNKKECYEGFKL